MSISFEQLFITLYNFTDFIADNKYISFANALWRVFIDVKSVAAYKQALSNK